MRWSLPAGLLLCAAAPASSQNARPARELTDTLAQKPAPGCAWLRHDLRAAGAVALATATVMPFDTRLAAAIRGPGPQRSAGLRRGAAFFNVAGDPGVLIVSAALYGIGRAAGATRVSKVGGHAVEAIVVSGTATSLLKLIAGRQRPNVEVGDADDFVPARGFRPGRASLPSGHTTVAFAFASALSAELRLSRPDVARIASPLLYAGAASVGVARMYDDRHWASDVVLGAGIGTLVGLRTVAYAHAHPRNRVDRLLRTVTVAPTTIGPGLAVGVHRTTR